MICAKKILYATTFVLASSTAFNVLCTSAIAQVSDKPRPTMILNDKDREGLLLQKIHVINIAEIKIGNLALTAAKGAETRKYATMLIKDHTTAEQKVWDTAKADGIRLESSYYVNDGAVNQLQYKLNKVYDNLKAKDKDSFDKAFAKAMYDGHDEAINLIVSESQSINSANLKTLVDELLPSLRIHKDMANGDKIAHN